MKRRDDGVAASVLEAICPTGGIYDLRNGPRPTSLVELRLSPDGDDRTRLELEHTVPIEIAQSGAGALFVGPEWDGGFVALDLYLRGEVSDDPVAAANSPEGIELVRQSVDAWVAAVESSGTATAEEIATLTEISLAQFAPE